MRQKLVVSILCVMSMFLYPGKIFAYPLDVHERITIKLINQNEQVLNNHLKNIGLSKGVDENINKMTVRKWIEYGSWKEDFNWDLTNNPLYSHFYNPLTNTSGVGDTWPSAYDWAEMPNNEWAWKKAREYYYLGLTANGNPYGQNSRELFLSFAFRALGHSMHLVQDMAVPAHTRGDLHADIIISSIVGKDYYEAYTKKAIDYLNYKEVPFPYWNVSISPGAPRQFWDLDSYKGTVPYYTGYIGLAEYTNANFFSRDTIFKDFPHPAKENTTAALYEQTAKDGKLDSVWYIQGYTSERLAAYSYFWKNGIPPTAGWLYNLDDYVHEDYARQLIPRAVGYSAGLLNYFFRGNMDMKPDDAAGSGYVIVNNSEEDMNGIFELFYDNTGNQRVKIMVPAMSAPITIGKKSSGNNKSPIITFSAPTDAKEPGKYMLVFKGKMGSEEGAVAGKIVKAGGIAGRLVQADSTSGGISLKVYTESGLISASFNIVNSGIIAVRFNLSNHDDLTVAVKPNKIYKFTVDEFNKSIDYQGLVAEYPEARTEEVIPFCEEIVDDCEGLIGVPGDYKIVDEQRLHSEDGIIIQDFYYDTSSIKPFGSFYEQYYTQYYVRNFCGDKHMRDFDENLGTITDEGRHGIYYDAKLMNALSVECVGGITPQSCSDKGKLCRYQGHTEMVDTYKPIAIFNSSGFAYAHYRAPYGYYSLSGCNYMSDLISPVPLPCSVEQVKAMLRKDNGQSLYYKDPNVGQYGTWYSYSSGFGTMEGRYLISNYNPSGEHIGWDGNGNIVKVFYDNGQLIIKNLKHIGGSFSGFFDVSLKFPD